MNIPEDRQPVSGDEEKRSSGILSQYKTLLTGFGIVAIILIWYIIVHNDLVKADEAVGAAWSQVQNVYHRRAELIPGLVAIVRGSAAHDETMLRGIEALRTHAADIPSGIVNDQHAFTLYTKDQARFDSAVGELIASGGSDRVLQADKNFRILQSEVEGAENRIAVERRRYIAAVQQYNTMLRRIPTTIVAALGGFKPKANFVSDPGDEKAPGITLQVF